MNNAHGPWAHDLRLTAARDYRRYMSEQEIVDLCGWKTASTFARYHITTPKDVDAALAPRSTANKRSQRAFRRALAVVSCCRTITRPWRNW
jgi:AraC-like DNA-binding protein